MPVYIHVYWPRTKEWQQQVRSEDLGKGGTANLCRTCVCGLMYVWMYVCVDISLYAWIYVREHVHAWTCV